MSEALKKLKKELEKPRKVRHELERKVEEARRKEERIKEELKEAEKKYEIELHERKREAVHHFGEIDRLLHELIFDAEKMGWHDEAKKLERLKLDVHGVAISIGSK